MCAGPVPRVAWGLNPLWWQIPTNAFAVNDEMTLVLHGTVEGGPYCVLTKESLSAADWTPEQPVAGAAGDATITTVFLNGRTSLFLRASLDSGSSDSSLWTSDTASLTADLEGGLLSDAGGVPLTADTTEATTDAHP
jgi:hypothetical protein